MSLRAFKIAMGVIAGAFILFLVGLAGVLIRGEDTRNIVEKVDSSCARANDPTLPMGERRSASDECSENVCFALRNVLTSDAFEQITRCHRREVVPQNSPTASQQPGPSGGRPPAVPEPDPVPSRPVEAPSSPPTEPPVPAPAPSPEPTAPSPDRPLIDLTPVTDPVCDLTRPIAAVC